MFEQQSAQSRRSKYMILAIFAAVLIVGVATFLILSIPTKEEIERKSLEGAVREGSAEFEVLTRKISISTDEENTKEATTALGTVVMFIAGRVRNMTGKAITGLEIKVTVVDQMNKPVKERILTVVPSQKEALQPNEVIPVRVMIDGFKKDDDRAMIRWKVTAIKVQD